ncbi:hypothetical protein [Asticcacaulis sp. YBE204]|uniref:hypothetical protein n=1 Tax=Asticcacaulis sp. YBE204 TaxID=1282363 RepID=UPI000428A4FE|nr:hypothetical protein [Asticcacaulis sp. YBE204]
MDALLGQLDLLQDLALKAGDPDLAQDLNAMMARTLERYCATKRSRMEQQFHGRKHIA